MTTRPLAGVRVLDFSRVLAGPFCTMQLADMGAEVIKIENPHGGDDTRAWGPPWSGEQSAYYLSVNRSKRSLALDLKTAAGQAIARQLARDSHVIVENFKVGDMARYGLGYAELHTLNPALVYCSITGFGQTGPYRDLPGYDYVIQAMSGLMSITGPADGEPYKIGVAIADVLAGLFALGAILAALRHAEQTGQGRHIDIALLDSQIAALVNVAANYLVSGQPPARYGNQHPNIVPYQTFYAADGQFVLAVGNDRQFARVCALIDQPDLVHDPRFATNPARVQNRAALAAQLQAAFLAQPVQHWVDALWAAGIPGGPIYDIPAALSDPQVQARGIVAGDFIGPVLRDEAGPLPVRHPPPTLGQHTREILTEMGYDAAQIDTWTDAGVIA